MQPKFWRTVEEPMALLTVQLTVYVPTLVNDGVKVCEVVLCTATPEAGFVDHWYVQPSAL